MTPAPNIQPTIVRNERGLTIAGTRITLYDVMDHLKMGRPPELILNCLPLTQAQLKEALLYLERNRAEVEAEYQEILQTAEEVRQYWGGKNQERFDCIAANSPKVGKEALWEKLEAQKAIHATEYQGL